MQKNTPTTPAQAVELIRQIREIILTARSLAARSVDTVQVSMNFAIGQRIVEHEQGGEKRAEYGKKVLATLGEALKAEFGRGFSRRNLGLMRQFYLTYSSRVALDIPHGQAPAHLADSVCQIHNSSLGQQNWQTPSANSARFAPISWSHYVVLLSIGDPAERSFYELEATQQGWSLRELERQVDACLYERLALSRGKEAVSELARAGDMPQTPRQFIKDPLVLEFLGLEEKTHYSERDLESAIIDRLEAFLLELGKGFLFEARQKRFTFGADHFYVDLVFYNRLLRCYVLIDLKIGKLTHQDLGQMQMYVNYFDRHVKLPDENPSIGILLCKQKHDALVELTLPEDANIYASQYQLYLPSKEELQQRLQGWIEDVEPGDGN